MNENKRLIKCNPVMEGIAEGEVLYTEQAISFYGGVDINTGEIIEKGHELEGETMAGKILIFPHGKGSTVGSYVIYGLKKNNKAPLAIVNRETEAIIATGCILAGIPCVDGVEISNLKQVKRLKVNATKGIIEIIR